MTNTAIVLSFEGGLTNWPHRRRGQATERTELRKPL